MRQQTAFPKQRRDLGRSLARRGTGSDRTRGVKARQSRDSRDKKGRPVVVITWMGIVSPLGTGKADNWQRLTAGESGIRSITVCDRRLADDDRRRGRSCSMNPAMVSSELSEKLARLAGTEAIEESGIGKETSLAHSSWPSRRSKSNGHSAMRSPPPPVRTRRSNMPISSGSSNKPEFSSFYEASKYGVVPERLAELFRHQGFTDFADHCLRFRRNARSSSASKPFSAANCRRRLLRSARTDRSRLSQSCVSSLLSALSTNNTTPQRRIAALLQEPRWLRAGGRRRRRRAGKLRSRGRARREDPRRRRRRAARRLTNFHRTRSSPDGKPVISCMRKALDDAGA